MLGKMEKIGKERHVWNIREKNAEKEDLLLYFVGYGDGL